MASKRVLQTSGLEKKVLFIFFEVIENMSRKIYQILIIIQIQVALIQWCPTLSPFATCGDRQLFRNRFVMRNKPYFSQILQFIIQSGNSKAFVVTFVTTERILLDTTVLITSLARTKKLSSSDFLTLKNGHF